MKKTVLSFCILLSLGCGVFSAQADDTAELGMHHTVSTLHYIDSSGTVKTWSGETTQLRLRCVFRAGGRHRRTRNASHRFNAPLH